MKSKEEIEELLKTVRKLVAEAKDLCERSQNGLDQMEHIKRSTERLMNQTERLLIRPVRGLERKKGPN